MPFFVRVKMLCSAEPADKHGPFETRDAAVACVKKELGRYMQKGDHLAWQYCLVEPGSGKPDLCGINNEFGESASDMFATIDEVRA